MIVALNYWLVMFLEEWCKSHILIQATLC